MAGFDGITFQGVPFRGEFSATDPSTQVLNTEPLHRYTLYPAGSTAALSVASNDMVIITDISLCAAAASNVTIYDGSDISADAGETLFAARTSTTFTTIVQSLSTPVACQPGTYPKIVGSSTASGLVSVITGVIKRGV